MMNPLNPTVIKQLNHQFECLTTLASGGIEAAKDLFERNLKKVEHPELTSYLSLHSLLFEKVARKKEFISLEIVMSDLYDDLLEIKDAHSNKPTN